MPHGRESTHSAAIDDERRFCHVQGLFKWPALLLRLQIKLLMTGNSFVQTPKTFPLKRVRGRLKAFPSFAVDPHLLPAYENTHAMSMSRPPITQAWSISRPPTTQAWSTSATLHQPDAQPNGQQDNTSEPLSEPSPGQDAEKVVHTPGSGPSIQDLFSLVGIVIMLAWPWAFFGAVWATGGMQMSNHIAKVVRNNPHATTYFITLICSVISLITGALFSLAIVRFAQELVTHHPPTQPFHLRVLLAFRHQTWPWGKSVKSFKYLMNKNRWWPAVLLVVCIFTFPHLISSTTSLITPISFNRTADLTGTELDFSSTDVACQNWFNENPLSNTCSWKSYNGLKYTDCLGGNQMVDVLEAGRGNILELVTNNTQSITFSQLGGEGGLHFLGPIRGVLPIGLNGVPVFNTLEPSPFSNSKIMAGLISYDYTLNHQGLTSNVSCSYTSTNPFIFSLLDPASSSVLQSGVNCTDQGKADVLTDVPVFRTPFGNHTMVYWACQSAPNEVPTDSYSIYLAGLVNYTSEFGNITCTVHPIQTAVFPLTYDSTANNFEDNLVAESVIALGVKSFGLQGNESNPLLFLWLFEQMIQGMIEYEATYLRLIYSTIPNPPASCTRTVTGLLKYEVFGWFVTSANIGFLIPITIINAAALVALSIALWMARTGGYIFHPFYPRPVAIAEHVEQQEQLPDEWRHKVAYHPKTVLKEYFHRDVERNLKEEGTSDVPSVEHNIEKHHVDEIASDAGDSLEEYVSRR